MALWLWALSMGAADLAQGSHGAVLLQPSGSSGAHALATLLFH